MPYSHLAVLDGSVVAGLRALQEEDQPDFFSEMAGIYLGFAPPTFEKAARAVSTGDPAAYEEAIHRLKNSSASLGAARLARCCFEIEDMLHHKQPAPAFARFPRLKIEYQTAIHAIQEEVDRGQPDSNLQG